MNKTKQDRQAVDVEEISVELFKISHKLKLLADLTPKVVECPPAREMLYELSMEVKEMGMDFLELA